MLQNKCDDSMSAIISFERTTGLLKLEDIWNLIHFYLRGFMKVKQNGPKKSH